LHLTFVERDRLSAMLNDSPGGAAGDSSLAATRSPGPIGRLRARIPPQVRFAFSFGILFFLLEYLVLPEIAAARKDLHVLGQVNAVSLVIAVLLEAAALLTYAELSRTVLEPDAPSRSVQLRINMSSLALSHIVPGGTAPGGALAYRLLTDEGVSGSVAAFGLAAQGMGSAVVLNMIFWVALVVSIPLTGFNRLYAFAALASVFLLLAFFGTVALVTRGQRHADAWLRRVAVHMPFTTPDGVSRMLEKIADRITLLLTNRRLLSGALTWASANWLLDAASLWVFLWAFGHFVSPVDLLVAYGLANIVAVLPITPGGLGIVEGTLIPTLVWFRVPVAVATVGVLSWRLVNFWLPIPVGGGCYFSLKLRRRRRIG
jgi:putative heme transporter